MKSNKSNSIRFYDKNIDSKMTIKKRQYIVELSKLTIK